MSNNEFLGMLLVASGSLGGFIYGIWKIFAPINNNLVRFNMNIERLFEDNIKQDKDILKNRDLIFENKDMLSNHETRIQILERKGD